MSSSSATLIAVVVVVVVGVLVIGIISTGYPLLVLPGPLVGSGHLVSKQENFAGFTAVSVGSGFKFTITQSASYGVNVTIDDNLLSYVQVSQTGNALSIGLALGHNYQSPSPSIEIAMPDMTQLDISTGANGVVTGFNSSHDFAVTAADGSGASMDGGARDLTLDASGGSHLDLSGFHVVNANVNLSTGSQATVSLDGRLDATLSDGSRLIYVGNPALGNINISGGATLSKG